MRLLHALAVSPVVALLVTVVGLSTPAPALAAPKSAITLNVPSPISPGQLITVSGKLTVGGKPAPAGTPVVIHIRPSGGPDVNVGDTKTDAHGHYSLRVRVPNKKSPNYQVTATSGGGAVQSARIGKIVQGR